VKSGGDGAGEREAAEKPRTQAVQGPDGQVTLEPRGLDGEGRQRGVGLEPGGDPAKHRGDAGAQLAGGQLGEGDGGEALQQAARGRGHVGALGQRRFGEGQRGVDVAAGHGGGLAGAGARGDHDEVPAARHGRHLLVGQAEAGHQRGWVTRERGHRRSRGQ
jgi:hypothetical protein